MVSLYRKFSGRVRVGLVLLMAYWLAMFVATHTPQPAPLPVDVWDKLQHFAAYALLALLISLGFQTSRGVSRLRCLAILLVVMTYGAVDELLQLLVPGRNADPLDWVANTLGALFAVGVHALVANRWPSRRRS